MSTTAPGFGEATYEDQHEQVGATNGAPHAAAEVDPNDPRLISEVMDVNLEGNAYAQPVPPPDGWYRAKLKLSQVPKVGGGTDKVDYNARAHDKNGPYYASALEASIIDPSGKFDGVKIYDPWVSTFKNRDGGNKIQTILSFLSKPDGTPYLYKGMPGLNQLGWIELYVKAMAGEPEVMVETAWEFSCQKCGEAAEKKNEQRPRGVMGMHKFAPSKKGGYDPDMKCPVDAAHGYSRARPRITGFQRIK